MRELDLCSPMVCGMSRGEHDAHIKISTVPTVDGFLPGKRGDGSSTPFGLFVDSHVTQVLPLASSLTANI
jgi:hypothetical protein